MTRWAYVTLTLNAAPGSLTDQMAVLGESGWEFCAVLPDGRYLFKRPVEEGQA